MLRKHCVQRANTAQPTLLRTYHKPCAYPDFSRAWRQPRIPACAMRATATQAWCQKRCNARRGAQASDRCHARAQAATARFGEWSRLGSTVVHTVSHSAVLQRGPHPPCTGKPRWIAVSILSQTQVCGSSCSVNLRRHWYCVSGTGGGGRHRPGSQQSTRLYCSQNRENR